MILKNSTLKKTALVSALMLATGGHAATINVDGTTCNMADAITSANTDTATGGCLAGSGADVLELDIAGSPFSSTVQLPIVASDIVINGNGSTVSRDVASATKFRVFEVSAGGALTLNDVTVTGGDTDNAGAVANFGGGVRAYGGSLNINNSTFTGNNGGAIMFSPGTSGGIESSVIDSNQGNPGAGYYGGGISITGATVTINNSTVSNNTTDSTIGSGAVYISNYGGNADVVISNSTISGNTSTLRGGGISHLAYGNNSTISLINVTLVDNTSSGNGGGISNDSATILISQSLISGNTGSGGAEIDSAGGTIVADDYNIFGLNSTAGVVGVTVGTSDIVPAEATLADIIDVMLTDNGGPTPTHALAAGSPAIDAVPAASCASATDQTGLARPQDGDGDMMADCDIGAYEVEGVDLDLIFEDGFEG